MSTVLAAIVFLIASIAALAYVLNCRRPRNRAGAMRSALRFIGGPFPLSISIHLLILLLLIITVHESRGRELIMVNLEAGGGGGSGDEMRDLDLGEAPMPDLAPPTTDAPIAADTSSAVAMADSYVRSADGIGIGGTGGLGTGHGPGFGSGWGGFVMDLRRRGFDVVLVIDGTGSMKLVIDEVKARMHALMLAIHHLVPTARIGIVVYGGKHEPIEMQPLTLSASKLESFLDSIHAGGGDQWEENVGGALESAIKRMDWKEYATKVIVLVPDSPPEKGDLPALMAMARSFHGRGGTLNAIDLTQIEHQRFERAFAKQIHRCADSEPGCGARPDAPMPAFYRQTQLAYQVLTREGGGEMRALREGQQINDEVMILAFGQKWRAMVERLAHR